MAVEFGKECETGDFIYFCTMKSRGAHLLARVVFRLAQMSLHFPSVRDALVQTGDGALDGQFRPILWIVETLTLMFLRVKPIEDLAKGAGQRRRMVRVGCPGLPTVEFIDLDCPDGYNFFSKILLGPILNRPGFTGGSLS